MERESLDAYIISGTDPHNSEYLPAAWKQRQWISGFTGSFGTVVVLKNEAGLWTDTRYFIQAEKQLKDSGIQMHKMCIRDSICSVQSFLLIRWCNLLFPSELVLQVELSV